MQRHVRSHQQKNVQRRKILNALWAETVDSLATQHTSHTSKAQIEKLRKKYEKISVETRDHLLARWLYHCNKVYVDSVMIQRKLLNRIGFPDDTARLHFWEAYKKQKCNKSYQQLFVAIRARREDDLFTIENILKANSWYYYNISIMPAELDTTTDPEAKAAQDKLWSDQSLLKNEVRRFNVSPKFFESDDWKPELPTRYNELMDYYR